MLIQNEQEAERVSEALSGLSWLCHREHTSDDGSVCAPYHFGVSADRTDYFCLRLFPKIAGSRKCPCQAYNKPYVYRKARRALKEWEESC